LTLVNRSVFLETVGFVTVLVNVWALSCKIICVVMESSLGEMGGHVPNKRSVRKKGSSC